MCVIYYESVSSLSCDKNLVSIIKSSLRNLEKFEIILSAEDLTKLGMIMTIAGPEPDMPAALAPAKKASLENFRPLTSLSTPQTALPLIVKQFNISPC